MSPQNVEFERCVPLVRSSRAVKVHNSGAEDAHVSVAVLDAPWLDVEPRICVIEPNSSKLITVHVTLDQFAGDDDGNDNNDDDDSQVVRSASRNTVLVLHTRGGG